MATTEGLKAGSDVELDRHLGEVFAFEPPPGATAAADRRVARVIALGSGGAGREARGGAGFLSRLVPSALRTNRRGRIVLVLAGMLILGGAGGGVFGLYEGMVGSEGGARTAWDMATVVAASQTVGGYKVTIERAYADPNQLMLAISVTDIENRGWTQIGAMGATVTDEAGREFDQSMGMSTPDGSSLAANLAWFQAPAGLTPGRHTLSVSVPTVSVRDNSTPPPDESPATVKSGDSWDPWHTVAGPWTFTIPVDVFSVAAAQLDGDATVSGTHVQLTAVRISPASVVSTIAITGAGGVQWIPVGQFEHAGRTYPINNGSLQGIRPSGDAAMTIFGDGGTTNASGEWTLRISQLVGNDGTQQLNLAGPWVLTFSMP